MATFFDSIVKSRILNSVKSLWWSFYAKIVNFQLLTFFAKKPLHECQAVLHLKKKELYYFTYFYLILYDFINCLAFVVIKQNFTLKSSNRVNIIRETFILYALLDKVYQWLFQTGFFFHLGDKKKWLLVALDRRLCYTVTIVREFAWVDSALAILYKWSSYRGGCLNRFDCNALKLIQNNFVCLMEK